MTRTPPLPRPNSWAALCWQLWDLAADVEDETSGALAGEAIDAVVPAVFDRGSVPGRGKGGQGAGGAAAHQDAVAGEVDEFGDPPCGAAFEVYRCLVAACAARVHGACDQVRENALEGGRRVAPAEEPRVTVPERVGKHMLGYEVEQLAKRQAVVGERLRRERVPASGRDLAPHRPARQRVEVVGHDIDHGVAVAAELLGRHWCGLGLLRTSQRSATR